MEEINKRLIAENEKLMDQWKNLSDKTTRKENWIQRIMAKVSRQQ